MGEVIECGLGALVLTGEKYDPFTQRDRLFLARYIKNAAQFQWNGPGGKLNQLYDGAHNPLYHPQSKKPLYEDPAITCVREFKEETNLDVKVLEHLYTTDRPGKKNNNTYRIHMYLCELVGEYKPILDPREFDMCGLFNIEELAELEKTDHVTEQLIPELIRRKLIY